MSVRGAAAPTDVDGYLERLAKYVPVEILTAFTFLAAAAADQAGLLAIVFVACAVLAPVYLFLTWLKQPMGNRPKFRRILYLLAPISFFVWAINTSEAFRGLAGTWPILSSLPLNALSASVILVLGALIIPAIDIIVDYQLAKREA